MAYTRTLYACDSAWKAIVKAEQPIPTKNLKKTKLGSNHANFKPIALLYYAIEGYSIDGDADDNSNITCLYIIFLIS